MKTIKIKQLNWEALQPPQHFKPKPAYRFVKGDKQRDAKKA